ncbi:Baeyer-Villiger monooxygenase, partial [Pseudolycoriella hygida]
MEGTLDALIVGAGFAGLYVLYKLRNEGLNVKIFEGGSGIGGTWFRNRYPGARTDSANVFYQFMEDGIWQSFNWNEKFAGQKELLSYFNHVDQMLQLSKDIQFNTKVKSAEFHKSCEIRYTPPFKGLTDFRGDVYHTSLWPESEVNFKGKRVAVIGTGASGVQVIQEIGPDVEHLTVYQRTPNLALPMRQTVLKSPATPSQRSEYQELFALTRKSFFGMDRNFVKTNAMDVTADDRKQLFEELYATGGFAFAIGNYQDFLVNKDANDAAYAFWCEKTRARIDDPMKKDLLAPIIPPHPIFAKRASLEQRYYEVFNQKNVDIIDVRKSSIIEMTASGIRTEKEGVTEFDVIILATGFDSVTGGILNIQIVNGEGEKLTDKWKEGTWTNLGLCTADYPNMYFLYGPQAPTAFSNGPTCIEIQGDWIAKLIVYMKDQNKSIVVATKEAEIEWKCKVMNLWNATLFCETPSWYNGANIPGKRIEPLNYAGGIPAYVNDLKTCAENGYEGFNIS